MNDAYVSTEKREAVARRLAELRVREEDLVEKFVLGSGSGGQKINKTSSCVYLKHVPSGIEIKCQRRRSRELNRLLARRELCERLTEKIEGERSRRQMEREKIRRQKRRRSRRQKARMLEDKRKQGDKKRLRGKVEMGCLLIAALVAGAGAAEPGRGNVQRSTLRNQHTTQNAEPRTRNPPSMSAGQAIVLGLVEGITEYLPISSTGHLLLTQRAMGLGEGATEKVAADAYAICIQAGAILAVVGLYYRRLFGIARGFMGAYPAGLRLGVNLLLAFAPAAIAGLTLEGVIKTWLFGGGSWGLWPTVAAWLGGGVLILAVDRWMRHGRGVHERLALEGLTWRMALAIGTAQCAAMWPGVSRSLATILGGVAAGLALPAAVEFSFLLGLVTLGASTALDALRHGGDIVASYGIVIPLFGLMAAMVSAAAAMKWMVHYLQRHGMAVFGYYRIVLALVVAAVLWWR
jgi:undecaprenyl-diphosphatase